MIIPHSTQFSAIQKNSAGIKQSLTNIAGSVVASGFAAISLMLLSRFLGPQLFGQFSSAFALTMILVRLNDLGLSVATSKLVPEYSLQGEFSAKNQKTRPQLSPQQQALLALITRYRLALYGLIVALGLITSQFLPNFLLQNSPALLLIAFFVTGASTLYEHAQFTLQALHQSFYAAMINAAQGLIKLILAILITILLLQETISPDLLLPSTYAFYMLAPAIPVFLLLLNKNHLFGWVLRLPEAVSTKQLTQQKKSLWSLTKHAGLGIAAAGIIENIDILFVQAMISDFQAGLLGGVSRIALLLYVVGYALGNVLNPRVANYKNQADLEKFWQKSWLVTAGCVLGFVLSMFLAKPLLIITIGREYLPALFALRILLAAGFITIALMPFTAFFYSFNLSWYFSLTGVLQLAIVLLGNYWLVPWLGIEGAALTRLLARAALLLLTIVLARNELINMKNTKKVEIETTST